MDEFPEFSKSVIEVLRQPMEDGEVNISRVTASLSYPSQFLLIASMNPCPCGYYGDPTHTCSCSMAEIQRYVGKVSNPILDRIDIHIQVNPVQYSDLTKEEQSESSATIRARVNQARNLQIERYKNVGIINNSQLTSKLTKRFVKMEAGAEKLVETAFHQYKFSARSFQKILKLSRTIADLDQSETVTERHVLESIRYRSLEIGTFSSK